MDEETQRICDEVRASIREQYVGRPNDQRTRRRIAQAIMDSMDCIRNVQVEAIDRNNVNVSISFVPTEPIEFLEASLVPQEVIPDCSHVDPAEIIRLYRAMEEISLVDFSSLERRP